MRRLSGCFRERLVELDAVFVQDSWQRGICHSGEGGVRGKISHDRDRLELCPNALRQLNRRGECSLGLCRFVVCDGDPLKHSCLWSRTFRVSTHRTETAIWTSPLPLIEFQYVHMTCQPSHSCPAVLRSTPS